MNKIIIIILIIALYVSNIGVMLMTSKILDSQKKINDSILYISDKYRYFYQQYMIDNHDEFSKNRGDGILIKNKIK